MPMIYEQESIKLLQYLGLYGQRPEAFIRLTSYILSRLSRSGGYGVIPLPYNNNFGVNGKKIHPSNFLDALEALPKELQLFKVERSDGKLHWFHDDEILQVDDDFDITEELDKRMKSEQGFRKANGISLNSDLMFEFMTVTGMYANTLKESEDTLFLRDYYLNTRIHTDKKNWAIIDRNLSPHLIKLLPHCADKIYRDHVTHDELSGEPIGPYNLRIYGAKWHNLPKTGRQYWSVLNWKNRQVYKATELMDLDINSCALAVVSNHFGYDAHEIVAKLSQRAFDAGEIPLEGFTRRQVKAMVNSIIHGGFQRPATTALSETNQEIAQTIYSNNAEIVDILCNYLPPLKHVIGYHRNSMIEVVGESGRKYKIVPQSAKLHFMYMYQQVESDWAMAMLRYASNNNLTVLTFHDGFTVPSEQLPQFKAYSDLVLPRYLSVSVDPFVSSDNRDSDLIATDL